MNRRAIGSAVAVVLAVASVGCGSSDEGASAPATAWQPTATLTVPSGDALGPAITIWTGSEVVLVGGLVDGATGVASRSPAFDPAQDRWRTIAAPPTPFVRDVYPSHAVWTGSEILWFGSSPPPDDEPRTEGQHRMPLVGAAYEPDSDVWRALASPPAPYEHFDAAVWTGAQLLVWSSGVGVAVFAPVHDTWTTTPGSEGPTFPVGAAPAVWDGSRLVVFAGYSGDVAAYDPATNQWTPWPAAPSTARSAVWTGTALLTLDPDSGAVALFDEGSQTWRPGTPGPFRARTVAATAWTGEQLAAWGGIQFDYTPTSAQPSGSSSGATYDPISDIWTDLPPLPDQNGLYAGGTWIGSMLFSWGASPSGQSQVVLHGATWRP
jgi:hypothetical protein